MTKQELMILSQTSLLGNISKAMRYICVSYDSDAKKLTVSCWLESDPSENDKELMYGFCGELDGHFTHQVETAVELFHDTRPYSEIIQDINKRQICVFAMDDNS